MKRILLSTALVLLLSANTVFAGTNVKAETKEIKNILKSQISAANKYNYPDFIKYFDLQYVNSDGFNLDVYSKLVEDTWGSYSNIQYAQQVKNISVMGKDAIAEVVETANAQVESQYNLKGNLKSVANNIYFLKKTKDGWKIVSDVILTEDTYLSFGELVTHQPVLNVPYQTQANKNYTATLEFSAPKDTVAIASINQEKVTFPQESAKENYRKLPEDGILERFFTANNENTNEYVVASIGLTRPVFENKDLQINITGVAYIIKRVNVVPENKFINNEGVVSVSERLEKIKSEQVTAKIDEEPVVQQKEIKKSKKDEKNVSAEVVSKPVEEKKEKDKKQSDDNEKSVSEKKIKPSKAKSEKVRKEKPEKEEKSSKGVFSPAPVGIPTSAIVCPIEEKPATEVEEPEQKTEEVVSEPKEVQEDVKDVVDEKSINGEETADTEAPVASSEVENEEDNIPADKDGVVEATEGVADDKE